jgi:hypothetical protein
MAKLRKRNNYGIDPALFKSLYQEKKKNPTKANQQSREKKEWTVTCGVGLSIPAMFIKW